MLIFGRIIYCKIFISKGIKMNTGIFRQRGNRILRYMRVYHCNLPNKYLWVHKQFHYVYIARNLYM